MAPRASIVSTPFSLVAAFGGLLANPAGDELTNVGLLIAANVLSVAVTVVGVR